jgi:uncharacterized protein (TIGR00303 family)
MTTASTETTGALSWVYGPPTPLTVSNGEAKGGGLAAVSRPELVDEFLKRIRATQPLFVCVAAHTDTSSIPGISSAGASLNLIPTTPAADLEALIHGRPVSLTTVPSNPLGPPGPALITRAALALSSVPWLPVTIGLRVRPSVTTFEISHASGGCIDVEPGVADSCALFVRGQELGAALARERNALVIAETVPGGTTTAMAVLRALGCSHRVSSSSADDTSVLKASVVDSALRRSLLAPDANVFEILDAVGDPMQPFVMGMLCATARDVPVILAGGTQMAAVLALVDRLEQQTSLFVPRSHVLLATTPWVARDPHADLAGILNDRGAWAGAIADLDFSTMDCLPLRSYERLLVKEGVGAGGACVAALALGRTSLDDLHREIDAQYLALFSDGRG